MDTRDLTEHLVADLRAVSPLPSPAARAVRWGATAVLGVAIGIAVYGPRADLPSALLTAPYVWRLAALALVVVASIVAALQLDVPGPPVRLRGAALALVGALASVGVVALARGFLAGDFSVLTYGWDCLGKVTVAAAVPAITGMVMVERGAPLSPRSAHGFGALAAGTIGCLAAELACPEPESAHLFVWHLVPALLLGVGGMLLPMARPRLLSLNRT